jgi:hypothetical protein
MTSARPPRAAPRANQQGPQIDFDKREWLREFKTLKKEGTIADHERFKPLLHSKRDFQDVLQETERDEKKQLITMRKEQAGLFEFVNKIKLDVNTSKSMIGQSKSDPSLLEKVHTKVQTVETHITNFKLKSRAAYE